MNLFTLLRCDVLLLSVRLSVSCPCTECGGAFKSTGRLFAAAGAEVVPETAQPGATQPAQEVQGSKVHAKRTLSLTQYLHTGDKTGHYPTL